MCTLINIEIPTLKLTGNSIHHQDTMTIPLSLPSGFPYLLLLPEDLIGNVISFLEPMDMVSLTRVSKFMHELTHSTANDNLRHHFFTPYSSFLTSARASNSAQTAPPSSTKKIVEMVLKRKNSIYTLYQIFIAKEFLSSQGFDSVHSYSTQHDQYPQQSALEVALEILPIRTMTEIKMKYNILCGIYLCGFDHSKISAVKVAQQEEEQQRHDIQNHPTNNNHTNANENLSIISRKLASVGVVRQALEICDKYITDTQAKDNTLYLISLKVMDMEEGEDFGEYDESTSDKENRLNNQRKRIDKAFRIVTEKMSETSTNKDSALQLFCDKILSLKYRSSIPPTPSLGLQEYTDNTSATVAEEKSIHRNMMNNKDKDYDEYFHQAIKMATHINNDRMKSITLFFICKTAFHEEKLHLAFNLVNMIPCEYWKNRTLQLVHSSK